MFLLLSVSALASKIPNRSDPSIRYYISWINQCFLFLVNSCTALYGTHLPIFSIGLQSTLWWCYLTESYLTEHPVTPIASAVTLPPTWTLLAPGPQECCVCNVTTIFYSCRWSVWVALLETGTQSLLPVNTNLMGRMAGKNCSSWGKMACIRNEQQRCVRHEQKAARGKKWQRSKCLWLEKG